MNPSTGHLINLPDDEEQKRILQEMFRDNGYEPVPPELGHAANLKLAGRNEAVVSLTSGGKLSRWAAQKRKERRKTARESRRRNRN